MGHVTAAVSGMVPVVSHRNLPRQTASDRALQGSLTHRLSVHTPVMFTGSARPPHSNPEVYSHGWWAAPRHQQGHDALNRFRVGARPLYHGTDRRMRSCARQTSCAGPSGNDRRASCCSQKPSAPDRFTFSPSGSTQSLIRPTIPSGTENALNTPSASHACRFLREATRWIRHFSRRTPGMRDSLFACQTRLNPDHPVPDHSLHIPADPFYKWNPSASIIFLLIF